MTECTITFQPEGKRVKLDLNLSILEGAIKGGIDLTSICGGKGSCTKCRIIIKDQSSVSNITDIEKNILNEKEINSGVRLACLTKVRKDLTVKVPDYSKTGKQRLQIEGIETPIKLDPPLKKYFITLEKPTLEDSRSDFDRIRDKLQREQDIHDLIIDFNLLKNLSRTLRENDWKITVVLWNNELIAVEPGDTLKRLYGISVDIGTTKLAGYLIDLNTGKVIAAGSLMNPQIPFGEDVISRLSNPNPDELHNAVINGLNEIFDDLKEKTGVNTEEIYEMTAVGNTIMHHLFFNINPKYLGYSPYPAVICDPVIVKNDTFNLSFHQNGKIYFLPTIAGFVGADTVGVILATQIHEKNEICLALDIGTNTEVVLGNRDKIIACSCASGPAFEGAHIKYGMRAASGAIEKVEINLDTLEVKYITIDNKKPVGICGSGMIDLLAEMFKSGIINVMGKFNKDIDNPRIKTGEEGIHLIVALASESKTKANITFSQQDVRQIILAKAAMQTGVRTLLKHLDVEKEQIKHLYLAGAFGSHINIESARTIGIYPEIDLSKVIQVGNAAGTGARMCLVSKTARELVNDISKKVKYIELGAEKDFQKEFLNSNFIPYSDLDEYPIVSEILKKNGNFPKKRPKIF